MTLRRLFSIAGLLLTFCAASAYAEVKTFNIASQSLAKALIAFSEQSDVVVMAPAPLVEGKIAPAVVGEMHPQQALEKLLKGSGLSSKVDEKGTVSIRIANKAADSAAIRDQLRLAMNGEATDTTAAAGTSESEENAQAAQDSKGIPEMLVKGARTSNIDIQRTEDDVQPYVVFTAEDIEHSMATNLDQFLMNNLTMNASRLTSSDITTQAGTLNGNQSSIDLRGLGPGQTLVLVNGRRIPSVSSRLADFTQGDINGIPMSSIARIEVLPSTAGGIYGGGATGGVINVILKDDYRGLEINARYDGTFRQDAAQRVLEANTGFSLEHGRTTIMLSGSHRDSIPMTQGDRDFLMRGRESLLQRNLLYTGTGIPLGSTSNIRSVNNIPLVLASNGRALGSSFTTVPFGYAGPASDGGAALVANAGKFNLEWPTGTQGLGRALSNAPEVNALRLNVRRNFTGRIDAFIDASLSQNNSSANWATYPQTVTVQPNTPNNPFLQTITVRFPANDFDYSPNVEATSDTLSVTGGVIVHLPGKWTAQGELGWANARHDSSFNQVGAYQVFEPAMRSGALNILRDVMAYPLDYTPYVGSEEFTGTFPKPMSTVSKSGALRLAGPIFNLPGGAVAMSTLVERRSELMEANMLKSYEVPIDSFTYIYYPPRAQSTESAYAEITAPLISAANAMRFVRGLELQASYRFDRIGSRTAANSGQTSVTLLSPDDPLPDFQTQTNHVTANQYTLGLRYQPLPSLALRVSNAVGVLPPSLTQLVPLIRLNFNSTTLDIKRGNLPVGIVSEYHSSGNPVLLPEQSDSWSAGAIFTPAFLPGLRLSADYTLIRKTDEISSLSGALDAIEEIYGEERIRRAALTPADQALGYTAGRIIYMDLGLTNITRSEVEAYDLRAEYRWNTAHGTFRANALATYQAHLQKQLLSTAPMREYMGFLDGPLEWRGNAGLTWDRGPWTVGWNMQYFDSYSIFDTTTTTATRAMRLLYQGADSIPRQVYHDLSFKYRVDEAPLWGGAFSRSELLVGISNVFDASPPLALYSSTIQSGASALASYVAPYGDPRMRRYSISLRKSFR